MADSPNTAPPQESSEGRPVLPVLGSCGCGPGCSCGCQSGGACSCGGSCG